MRAPAAILESLVHKPARLIAGVMSGTSLDAIDVAFVRIEGNAESTRLELCAYGEVPFDPGVRDTLLRNALPERGSTADICLLDAALAHLYADAVRAAAGDSGIRLADVDLVGCHGQTVAHMPHPRRLAGKVIRSSLQIGSGPALAVLLGIPVITGFRGGDMAAGGQGAPLAPYADYILFRSNDVMRILVNIGGIANVTILPRACGRGDVRAYDTGPGNMVIDSLARHLFREPCDRNGARAAGGRVHPELLASLMADEYFSLLPPKSTGREAFGEDYLRALLRRNEEQYRLAPEDLLATATELTAATVSAEILRGAGGQVAEVFVGGGGAYNASLMQRLRARCGSVPIRAMDDCGIPAAAKEAVIFALFANEWLFGNPVNLPRVTGAGRGVIAGSFSCG